MRAPTSAPVRCCSISPNARNSNALQKLASHALPGGTATWQMELHDAVLQLEKQTVQQRIEELQTKNRDGGLDEADKYELRALFADQSDAWLR